MSLPKRFRTRYLGMLFADIALIDKTREGINSKLELWRHTLGSRSFKLRRSKTEYLKCGFSGEGGVGEVVTIGKVEIPRATKFRYLGLIIEERGYIDEDINHRIRVGWKKWRKPSRILCDKRIPMGLKGKFYRVTVRPALLYVSECWPIKNAQVQRLMAAEMRMICRMCGYTRLDKLRNETIRKSVEAAPIEDKWMESRLRWFGHVRRRNVDALVRRCESISLPDGKRSRGRSKKSWKEVIKYDFEIYRTVRGYGS